MSKINVVCRNDVNVEDKTLKTVAVDAGLEYCLQNNLVVEVAIGDFDSLDPEILDKYQGDKITYNSVKDDSDLALALKYLDNYSGEVYVYGALGLRMDHSIMNLRLLYQSKLNVKFIDENNFIFKLASGSHVLNSLGYKYLSLLTFNECLISLSGVKYPLVNYILDSDDTLNLSNVILNDEALLDIKNGKVIVILSNN